MAFKQLLLRVVFCLSIFAVIVSSKIPAAPVIDDRIRVKQHRKGAEGNLVEGEEELRKVIVQWTPVEGAIQYEICHDCVLGENDQPEEGQGTRTFVDIGKTRGGNPVHIVPGCAIRMNTFHVRAEVDMKGGNAWTSWSEPRNFNVHSDETEPFAHHTEL